MPVAYSRLPPGRFAKVFVCMALFAPPALVYLLLWRSFTALPFLDDYPLLEFAMQLQERGSAAAKWLFVLTAQHNEYKLWFPHALVALQLFVAGRVNFGQLAIVADAVLAIVGLTLWWIARRDRRAEALGIAWFVPVRGSCFSCSTRPR